MVPEERLELSRVAPHGSKPCAYTNFATPARMFKNGQMNCNEIIDSHLVFASTNHLSPPEFSGQAPSQGEGIA